MKIATLYDIHGNLPALEAVLAEIADEKVDAIVVGGDALAGPLPAETLDLLRTIETPIHFIHGNGESEMLRYLAGEPINGLTPAANESTPKVAEKLSAEQQEFVKGWVSTVQLDSPILGKILFCHATPHNDTHIFTLKTPIEKIEPIFEEVDADIVVCGHTHMQFDLQMKDIRVVNSGSVGMPFGKTGAFWLLIEKDVVFRCTDYDKQAAAERVRQPGSLNGEAFANGNILSAPDQTTIMGLLAQLEANQTTTQ